MITLKSQPKLSDIEALVARVTRFPISVKSLIEIAKRQKFPAEVINFFKTFREDEIITDADDLVARTEQIELMQHEEAEQPREFWLVKQED